LTLNDVICRHLISGDVNGDGHDDVIISAPGFSSAGNYRQGRVYIIYGQFLNACLRRQSESIIAIIIVIIIHGYY